MRRKALLNLENNSNLNSEYDYTCGEPFKPNQTANSNVFPNIKNRTFICPSDTSDSPRHKQIAGFQQKIEMKRCEYSLLSSILNSSSQDHTHSYYLPGSIRINLNAYLHLCGFQNGKAERIENIPYKRVLYANSEKEFLNFEVEHSALSPQHLSTHMANLIYHIQTLHKNNVLAPLREFLTIIQAYSLYFTNIQEIILLKGIDSFVNTTSQLSIEANIQLFKKGYQGRNFREEIMSKNVIEKVSNVFTAKSRVAIDTTPQNDDGRLQFRISIEDLTDMIQNNSKTPIIPKILQKGDVDCAEISSSLKSQEYTGFSCYWMYVLDVKCIYREVRKGVSHNLAAFLGGSSEQFMNDMLLNGEKEIFNEMETMQLTLSWMKTLVNQQVHENNNIRLTRFNGKQYNVRITTKLIPLCEYPLQIYPAMLRVLDITIIAESISDISDIACTDTSLPSSSTQIAWRSFYFRNNQKYLHDSLLFQKKFYLNSVIFPKRKRKTKAQAQQELHHFLSLNNHN